MSTATDTVRGADDHQEAVMQRFRRVLLHLPDGDCGVDELAAVADRVRRNEAHLTLFACVDEPSRLRQFLLPGQNADEVVAEQAAELMEDLRSLAATVDVDVECVVDRGNAGVRVVQRVLRGEHDLVVSLDDDSKTSPDARRLVRKCPCPVWVIRPGSAVPASGNRVVAAVNPSPDEEDLNILILELASSMVERSGGELVVVHAWEMLGSSTRPGRDVSGRFGVSYDELLVQARGARADALDELLGRVRPYPIDRRIVLEHGRPEAAIPAVVEAEEAELLVMGTVGRGGVNGLLIGNTAERVLSQAGCSLIAVKPADFESPIRLDD